MKHNVYSVYDSKAEAYLPPFYLHADGQAIRSFTTAANTVGHDFNKFSGDFTLFRIGKFDDFSGMLEPESSHIRLCSANEVMNKGDKLNA